MQSLCALLCPGESREQQLPALAADWQLWVPALSPGCPFPVFAPWSVQSGSTSDLTAACTGTKKTPSLGAEVPAPLLASIVLFS